MIKTFGCHSSRFATIGCGLLLVTGCSQFVNPFHDELKHSTEVTTPSVSGIRAIAASKSSPQREYAQVSADSHDLAVSHGPLLFESTYEELINEDGNFEWTLEDYFDFAYWRARYLLNLVAVPVSIVVTPPWAVQESDGILEPNWFGELHDAKTVASTDCQHG